MRSVGNSSPRFRRLYRRAVAVRRTRRYERQCRENAINDRLVVFEAYMGRSYACSPKAIYQTILTDERYSEMQSVWAFRTPLAWALREQAGFEVEGLGARPPSRSAVDVERVFGRDGLEELSRATIVRYGSQEHYRRLAQARYWISNGIIPTHAKPRDGQVYLQTWHGTPLKRLGLDLQPGVTNATFMVDEIHERYLAEGRRFTYLVSPSPFATEKLSTAFGLPGLGMMDKVIETGYPRNDSLFRVTEEQARAILARLGVPEGKKVILYAPTWRDDQHTARVGYTYEADVDFDYLKRELGDEYVILFRAHYLVANDFDFGRYDGFVYDVSDISDIGDLYAVSDVLVTDYSSVLFDYANLGKPMIFYMYDLERYSEGLRGFYLQLSELPGPIVKTERELVAELRTSETAAIGGDPRLSRFRERFSPLDDGHASERVLEHAMPVDPEVDGANEA